MKRTKEEEIRREKNLRVEKKRRLEEKWGIIRWLTEFLEVDNLVEQSGDDLQEMGGQKVEQDVEVMSKFRKEIWNRGGKKIKWEEHNHVKIGGKEKNMGRGDIVWLEQLSQITYKLQRDIKMHYKSIYIKTVPSWAGSRKQRKFKRNFETVKIKMGGKENLLEQDEQITPPEKISKVHLSGRGREGWGDSRLSPAPKNTSTSHSPEKINDQDLMGGTVPTNNQVLPNQDNTLQGILGGTAPASGAGSTSINPVSRDMKNMMLQQELSGGTVQPNNFPPLQNRKEIKSKNEEILKTANMEEGSELMLQKVNFRKDDKLIFTKEDSELVPIKPSKKENLVIDYKKKTTSADMEDSQF